MKRRQHNLLITITFYVTCKATWRNSNMILMKQYFVGSASCIPAVFSRNFSSAGKGTFISGKAKNMSQRCTFLGARDRGLRNIVPPLLGNLGAKFSEMSFPHFKTYFMQVSRPYIHSFPCGK